MKKIMYLAVQAYASCMVIVYSYLLLGPSIDEWGIQPFIGHILICLGFGLIACTAKKERLSLSSKEDYAKRLHTVSTDHET